MRKPEIEYPCPWTYKVIGADPLRMSLAIEDLLQERPFELSESNRSETGKYVSLNLVLTVADESDRQQIYRDLQQVAAIKIIL